jgi:hypothetical protein
MHGIKKYKKTEEQLAKDADKAQTYKVIMTFCSSQTYFPYSLTHSLTHSTISPETYLYNPIATSFSRSL